MSVLTTIAGVMIVAAALVALYVNRAFGSRTGSSAQAKFPDGYVKALSPLVTFDHLYQPVGVLDKATGEVMVHVEQNMHGDANVPKSKQDFYGVHWYEFDLSHGLRSNVVKGLSQKRVREILDEHDIENIRIIQWPNCT